jgi:hypothetical protein
MESGELIIHGMFGAPDLRIIAICRAGAPFLATDFPRLSFRQPLRRPFQGTVWMPWMALDGGERAANCCAAV